MMIGAILLPPTHSLRLPLINLYATPLIEALSSAQEALLKLHSMLKIVADRFFGFSVLVAMCSFIFEDPLLYAAASFGIIGATHGCAWLRLTGHPQSALLEPAIGNARSELSAICKASSVARNYCLIVRSQNSSLTILELQTLCSAQSTKE
jgi:hypothetical protein